MYAGGIKSTEFVACAVKTEDDSDQNEVITPWFGQSEKRQKAVFLFSSKLTRVTNLSRTRYSRKRWGFSFSEVSKIRSNVLLALPSFLSVPVLWGLIL
jgi:hypothetical protein